MNHVDFIIVGQGLAGTALAWELTQRGRSVIVFNLANENRSSSVAAGLFNPITGRVMTKTWKAELLAPFLTKFYSGASAALEKKFFHPVSIYRPFKNKQEMNQWKGKSVSPDFSEFIKKLQDEPAYEQDVINPFGGIEIDHGGYLDVEVWLTTVRAYLKERNSYREEKFEEELLYVGDVIQYKDLTSEKIIFCTGCSTARSRWFHWVPVKPLKGQTISVKIEKVLERIYNRGVYVVPSGTGVYKVGATYEHPPFSDVTTTEAREELKSRLAELIRLPFEVVHQEWGIRPTTPDRRPLLGFHPRNKNVLIFSGLGTKGVSLSPYFALQLADWCEGKGDLSVEVNIYRFKALYSE